jgi:hypothetical protein
MDTGIKDIHVDMNNRNTLRQEIQRNMKAGNRKIHENM